MKAIAAMIVAALAAIAAVLAVHHNPKPAPPNPAPAPVQGTCIERAGLPDANCTPGAINPAVTSANIHATICVRGWTQTIRPPVSYTAPLKQAGIAAYGYRGTNVRLYEEDHLIPLELGGSPTSPANLWPEPYKPLDAPTLGAHVKDQSENRLKQEVCAGKLALAEAQREIATNWEGAH